MVVTRKLGLHSVVMCTLHISDDVFEKCEGYVVWAKNKGTNTPSWEFGLNVKLNAGRAVICLAAG
ncbi:MAG: hypothetical protein QGH70_05440, partial [Nitrospinota bacterium]|nr:hypothetical protein [Nitrospinota bacterium]